MFLATDFGAGGEVAEEHAAGGFVDLLAAGPGASYKGFLDLAGGNTELFGFFEKGRT